MVSESRRRKLQDPNYGKVPKANFKIELTEDIRDFPDDIEEEFNIMQKRMFENNFHDVISILGLRVSREDSKYFGILMFGALPDGPENYEARLEYRFSFETPLKMPPYFQKKLDKQIVSKLKDYDHLSSALKNSLDNYIH